MQWSTKRIRNYSMVKKCALFVIFQNLWPSLSYGLQHVLSENYTTSVAKVWNSVYDYICVFMKHGMENPDIDPDRYIDLERFLFIYVYLLPPVLFDILISGFRRK